MPGVSPKNAAKVIGLLRHPGNEGLSNHEIGDLAGISHDSVRLAKAAYKWGESTTMNISKIKRDGGLQPRAEMNATLINEYAADMTAGVIFPPVTVYYDGTNYWLADGFHRIAAALEAGLKKIDADVKMGDRRDALLFSFGVNNSHGLRRTNADKRRAVMSLLGDPEWAQWSDSKIAEKCKVSPHTVAKFREEMFPSTMQMHSSSVRKGADGKTRNTSNIGRKSNGESTNGHPKPTKYVPDKQQPTTEAEDESQDLGDAWEEPVGGTRINGVLQADTEETAKLRTLGELTKDEVIEVLPEPKGKTMVNGVMVDDPPFIAKKRAEGKILADTIPVINDTAASTPETLTPVREAGEDEPESDEDWLVTLPARDKLPPRCRRIFDADATLYRALAEARKTFSYHAARAMTIASRSGGRNAPFYYRLDRFLTTENPKTWTTCPPMDKGGCAGTGEVPMIGECPKCRGRGYWII